MYFSLLYTKLIIINFFNVHLNNVDYHSWENIGLKVDEEYPLGSIPSIRRNTIIAACFDVANLMERGGTGFQTIMEAYEDCDETMQPVVSIYPGFLNLCLRDKLYDDIDQESEMLSVLSK